MNFYEEYKPFRNYIRRFNLVESLVDIWGYSHYVIEKQPWPEVDALGIIASPSKNPIKNLFPWDLSLLVRELVLNAGTVGDYSLKNWNHLTKAVNFLRRLDEAAFKSKGGGAPDAIFELHRLAHRQFPWQTNKGISPMMRALKVYGSTAVDEVVVRELGMSAKQFIQLGMAVGGHFMGNAGMSTNQNYDVLGISKEASDAFFKRITCTSEQLREDIKKRQSYDFDWLYTWNPLEEKPLISFDPAFPDRVLCPIPRYLSRRTSGGLFFDLANSEGFSNPFGESFQVYIGEVINKTCPAPGFTALPEEQYGGKDKKHGVDWVLSDKTGHLFIECKAKRLTLNAKTLSNLDALKKDLEFLAQAICQHYRNINDALNSKTRWVPDNLPVYPLILTLEDWFIISPRVLEMLNEQVRYLLSKAEICMSVLEKMPYTIASAQEFEITSQIIAQVGINSVMSKKTTPEKWGWALLPFASGDFEEEMRHINWRLFEDDLGEMVPADI